MASEERREGGESYGGYRRAELERKIKKGLDEIGFSGFNFTEEEIAWAFLEFSEDYLFPWVEVKNGKELHIRIPIAGSLRADCIQMVISKDWWSVTESRYYEFRDVTFFSNSRLTDYTMGFDYVGGAGPEERRYIILKNMEGGQVEIWMSNLLFVGLEGGGDNIRVISRKH